MVDGLYSAAAGMAAQQKRLDAVANDISNVSTTGYKRLRVAFRDLLYQPAGRGGADGVQTGSGAAATIVGRGSAQGALIRTDRPLDVALSGPGFIRVRDRDGSPALTRDGSLALSADGQLRTSTGQLLDPPLRLPRGAAIEDVTIGPDGTVRAGDRRVGRIDVVAVRNPDGLAPAGDSLFRPTDASGPLTAAPAGTRVEQGVLEGSNVDAGDAMIDMMDAQRAFQLASRAIQTQDEVLGVANGVKQ
jgi:flagellar basal-body rod protein FlgG